MRNLQEQVKKAFCYQKLFWSFTVWINCSNDQKIFANSQPSALNFKSFSRSLEQFFLTVGHNNFGNKIPFFTGKEEKNIWTKYQFSLFLGAGDVNHSSGSGSQRGSQSALLSVKKERHKWPKGKDFLFSTWAFVIGKLTCFCLVFLFHEKINFLNVLFPSLSKYWSLLWWIYFGF